MTGPLRILVLYWYPGKMRPAIRHHLEAPRYSSQKHRLYYWNLNEGMPYWFRWVRFDVAILHTTLLCLRWSEYHCRYHSLLAWLRHHPCRKIAIPQDEYDHCEVLDDWLYNLGVADVFTNFGEDVRPLLYPRLAAKARFHFCYTGYIDAATAEALHGQLLPLAQRPLDLVYRAQRLPYWFGRQGQLKSAIADLVGERAKALGLRCDLSTRPEDQIESDAWFHFLGSARAVLGVESGSSALDRRGEIRASITWLLQQHPHMSFEEVSRQLPPGWDDYRFYALGPRHLEAVITRTVQVLVEGDYNGVLQPWRHYLPLRRDLANLDDILLLIRDEAFLERIAQQAYEDIYLSGHYTYASFAYQLEEAMQGASLPLRSILWQPWLPFILLRLWSLLRNQSRCYKAGLSVLKYWLMELRNRHWRSAPARITRKIFSSACIPCCRFLSRALRFCIRSIIAARRVSLLKK